MKLALELLASFIGGFAVAWFTIGSIKGEIALLRSDLSRANFLNLVKQGAPTVAGNPTNTPKPGV